MRHFSPKQRTPLRIAIDAPDVTTVETHEGYWTVIVDGDEHDTRAVTKQGTEFIAWIGSMDRHWCFQRAVNACVEDIRYHRFLAAEAIRAQDEALASLMMMTPAQRERAYGILWRDNSRQSPEKSIAARKELFSILSKDQQKRGIEYALALYGPTTEAEILSIDFEPPLTDVQRSVRDGTFNVRSATDEERAAIAASKQSA